MSGPALRVGFIGAGRVNFGGGEGPWDHASRLETFPNITVVAIVDPLEHVSRLALEKRKAGEHGETYRECQLFKTLDEMLDRVKVDMVVIGTPPNTRGSLEEGKDVELRCVKAGIHVFVEKPVSLAPTPHFLQYVNMVEKAQEETGAILSVGYMFRYHSAIQKMRELITSHGGPIMALSATYIFAYPHSTSAFLWDARRSGGLIIEQATHLCDLVRYLAGDVEDSSIQTQFVRDEGPGTAGHLAKLPGHVEADLPGEARLPRVTKAQWRFTRGGLGSLTHAVGLHDQKYEAYLEIILDGMRLLLNDPYTDQCSLSVRSSSCEEHQVYRYPNEDPYRAELEVFIRAIKDRDISTIQSPYSDAARTYKLTRDIMAAEEK